MWTLREGEVRRRAADTGRNSCPQRALGALCCGKSWAESRWYQTVGCLIASVCVFIWISVSVWICAEVCTLFVPQTVCPPRFLLQPHTDALLSCPSVPDWSFRSPLLLSVCYLQPSCHISPLPATFLVISEGVCIPLLREAASSERPAFLSCKNGGPAISQNRTAVQDSNRVGSLEPLSMLGADWTNMFSLCLGLLNRSCL